MIYPTLNHVLTVAAEQVARDAPEHVPGCACPPLITLTETHHVRVEVNGYLLDIIVKSAMWQRVATSLPPALPEIPS